MDNVQQGYGWTASDATSAHAYLVPKVLSVLPDRMRLRILDIGCGNGFVAGLLAERGHFVTGVDASKDGILVATRSYPKARFMELSVYDESFVEVVGDDYDVVISLEVIEHLYWPRRLIERAYQALKAGGRFIISTPYHGYLKNLAISVVDGWDRHFGVDWDGGHIKFFSRRTLASFMEQGGFRDIRFFGVGRFPGFWKSMLMTGEK